MLPSTLWQKEIAEVAINRRSTFIKLAFPTAIGGFLIQVASPGFYLATVITVLAVFIGCFGTGISLSKARADGMLQRIAVTPFSPKRIVLEQLAINSAIDLCQLLPLALVVAVKFGVYDVRLLVLLVALCATITVANLLGLVASLFAATPGEVMLYSSLAVFPLLYLGGVFSPIGPDAGWRSIAAVGIPFFYLQQSVLAALGAETVQSAALIGELSAAAICIAAIVATLIAPRAMRFE